MKRLPLLLSVILVLMLAGVETSRAQEYSLPNFSVPLPDFQGLSPLDAEVAKQVTLELLEWALNTETRNQGEDRGKAMAVAWATASEELRTDVIKVDFYIRNKMEPKHEWYFKTPLSPERRNKAESKLLELANLLKEQAGHQNLELARYLYAVMQTESLQTNDQPLIREGLAVVGGEPSWEGVFHNPQIGLSSTASVEKKSDPVPSKVTSMTKGNGEFAIRQALIKGLLVAQLSGSDYAGEASQMNATIFDSYSPRAPSEIQFNQDVGDSMSSALREVEKFISLRHDGLPPGKKIEISFEEQYSSKDGPSAAVACSLLLESLITGTPIDPKFAVTGDMNADGTVQKVGGIDGKIRGATRKTCTHVAIPSKNSDTLVDLIVLGEASTLAKIQVFSIATFDEALALAKDPGERDEKLNSAIQTFAEVQDVLNKPNGISWLSNGHVRERLQSVVQDAPNHQSAKLLLLKAMGQAPEKLTLRGSFVQIDRATKPIWEILKSGSRGANMDAVMDSASSLRRIRNILDPRTKPCSDALEDFSIALKEISNNDLNTSSPRYRGLQDELDRAFSSIKTEYNRIASDPDIQEELLE